MTTLSTYLNYTRRLLHDVNANYWPDSELIDDINQARFRVVCDTGSNRLLQTVYLSYNLEKYAFGSVTGFLVTNGGSGYTSVPGVVITDSTGTGAAATAVVTSGAVTSIYVTAGGSGYTAPTCTFSGGGGTLAAATPSTISLSTVDVINVTLLWGNMRVPMNNMPFTEFNSKMRVWQSYLGRPVVFSNYGQQTIYVGPIPDQYYTTEMDTVVTPTPLVNLTDVETVIFPYIEPVPYYAAYLAKYKEQSYQEASIFMQEYNASVYRALRSAMTRRLPSAYG
jgi:hypothetical protein